MVDKRLNYGRHIIKKYINKSIDLGHDNNVLDIGAGTGDDLMFVREAQKSAVLNAIECYPQFISKLEEKMVKVNNLDLEKDKLPFEKESMDIIMGNQILEHVKEVFWIMHEISRTLKVGGHLIIGVPNLASLHNRLLLMLGKQPTAIKNYSAHLRGYTKEDFINLLNIGFPGGYELQEFSGSNFYPFPGSMAKPLAKLFPGMAWGIFFRFQKKKEYKQEFLDYPKVAELQTNFYLG